MSLLATPRCSASSSGRNSRVDTGSLAALRCRKKSTSTAMTPLARALQLIAQVLFHRRPLALDDAEHHRVAITAVRGYLVVAQHRILLGAEPCDRRARGVIEPVRAEF